jgi:hypothetical protein
MEGRPHFADQLTLSIRQSPIGEQNNSHSCFQVDPKRAAAKAEVPNGMAGKVLACRRVS